MIKHDRPRPSRLHVYIPPISDIRSHRSHRSNVSLSLPPSLAATAVAAWPSPPGPATSASATVAAAAAPVRPAALFTAAVPATCRRLHFPRCTVTPTAARPWTGDGRVGERRVERVADRAVASTVVSPPPPPPPPRSGSRNAWMVSQHRGEYVPAALLCCACTPVVRDVDVGVCVHNCAKLSASRALVPRFVVRVFGWCVCDACMSHWWLARPVRSRFGSSRASWCSGRSTSIRQSRKIFRIFLI